MQAGKVSVLSALLASSCCLPPLILLGLTLVGVGTVGFAGVSSTMGSLKWYLLPMAFVGLGSSYFLYFRERKRCAREGCRIVNEKLTRTVLTVSTVLITAFLTLSFSPYIFGSKPSAGPPETTSGQALAVLDVQGMTCVSCEVAVKSAIKQTGAEDVTVSMADNRAYVRYDSTALSPDQFVDAVNKVGYRAALLEKSSRISRSGSESTEGGRETQQ